MKNLWDKSSRRVYRESCIFIDSTDATLTFYAEKILAVRHPATGKLFLPQIDYTHTPGSNRLSILPGSSMPVFPSCDIHPDPASAVIAPAEGYTALSGGLGGTLVRFDNRRYFSDIQFEVDYIASEMNIPAAPLAPANSLPLLRKKLQQKQPVKITLLGDSISEGFNATGYLGIPPYTPTWIHQFAQNLEQEFGSPIELRNRGVNGTSCTAALLHKDEWLNDRPDLMVIAYGMNDFTRFDTIGYIREIDRIRTTMQACSPETEYILVSSMSGNPEWTPTLPGPDAAFAAALQKYADETGENTVCANVFAFWDSLVQRKGFFSMTGNGVNHPNDFGHRVYAAVLSALFGIV